MHGHLNAKWFLITTVVLMLPSGLFPAVSNTNITAGSMCEVQATLTILNMLHSVILVVIEHTETCNVSLNEERKVGKC